MEKVGVIIIVDIGKWLISALIGEDCMLFVFPGSERAVAPI